MFFAPVLAAGPLAAVAAAQSSAAVAPQSSAAATAQGATATPIGSTSATEVQVSGPIDVHEGKLALGNGSTVTAGEQAVQIALTRGGDLRLCSTTTLHLSHDRTVDAPDSTALMLGLDRGAIEARYTVGKYSDVLLTPDLRILVSGPGQADLQVRVSRNGDTCIDNRGANAPYITVTSPLEGGLYRVQPGQHVSFEHGSLREVVDTETEPCGCPATPGTAVAAAGAGSGAAGKAAGGAGAKAGDTEFPLAVSEGLAAPPGPPTTPVAKPGEAHAQVTVPFTFTGDAARPAAGVPAGTAAALPAGTAAAPKAVVTRTAPMMVPASAIVPVQAPTPVGQGEQRGFLSRVGHSVGRFFSKVFG
jgi:hypothetical protein